MLDDYGFEIYEENDFPIAYLITFRTFGTWLHGDEKGAFGRRNSIVRSKYVEPNVPLKEAMQAELKQKPFILSPRARAVVEEAMREVCQTRAYGLPALNVRSNHAHAVVKKAIKPEKIVNDIKAYATRRLREAGLVGLDTKVWSRGSSTRYLWKPAHPEAAIDYVLYSQGDTPFGTVTDLPSEEIE
jgi:REP element-mobilizing transposase RayT